MESLSPTLIAKAYVSYARDQAATTQWASDTVIDLSLEGRFDELWEVVVAIAELEEEVATEALAVVAAGPLEDIVCKAGPLFIDRVERAAKFNSRMGRMLTGVWGRSADPAVWARVVHFCRAFPSPIDGKYPY